MSQIPDSPTSNIQVYVNGENNPSTSSTQKVYQAGSQLVADTLSNGALQHGLDLGAGQISSVDYQQSVQASINGFINSLLSGNNSDINLANSLLKALVGADAPQLPTSTSIQNQYNKDKTLTDNANALIDAYNDYLNSQADFGQGSALTDSEGTINSAQNSLSGAASYLSSLLDTYKADIASQNYTDAATVLSTMTSYYNSVVGSYSSASSAQSSYNSAVNNYYTNNPPPDGYTESAWNAAQAAINARNNDSSITMYYGSLSNLGNFQQLGQNLLSALPTLDPSLLPDSSSFGLPSSVDGSTDNASVEAALQSMIDAATSASQAVNAANSAVNANNSKAAGAAAANLDELGFPDYQTYLTAVTDRVSNNLTSGTFASLLGALGLQNNQAAQSLVALLLSISKGMPTAVLTNPSGGAVTGATLNTAANSQALEVYAQALAKVLFLKATTGGAYQGPVGREAKSTVPQTPVSTSTQTNATQANGASTATTTPTSDLLDNLPALTTDLTDLLGQISIVAAAQTLQNNDALALSSNGQMAQSEFLSAISNIVSNLSPTYLENRVADLLQSQGVTPSQADVAAINNTVQQFLTALQGNIANTLSGQANLATSTLGAQLASQYVQTIFQDVQTTQAKAEQQLDAQQINDQNLQGVVADAQSQAEAFTGQLQATADQSAQRSQQVSGEQPVQQPVQPPPVNPQTNDQNLQNMAAGNQGNGEGLQSQSSKEQLLAQNIQTLLQQLPQSAYLTSPGALAAQAASNNIGFGPNGALASALAATLPKDSNGNYQALTPTQLYNSVTSIQGQQTGTATFLQMVQNDPSHLLEEMQTRAGSGGGHGHAGQLVQQLQAKQQTTLAANANKTFADNLYEANNETVQQELANQQMLNMISNPNVTNFLSKSLLPGQNLLNKGLALSTGTGVKTPQARNTTEFPV